MMLRPSQQDMGGGDKGLLLLETSLRLSQVMFMEVFRSQSPFALRVISKPCRCPCVSEHGGLRGQAPSVNFYCSASLCCQGTGGSCLCLLSCLVVTCRDSWSPQHHTLQVSGKFLAGTLISIDRMAPAFTVSAGLKSSSGGESEMGLPQTPPFPEQEFQTSWIPVVFIEIDMSQCSQTRRCSSQLHSGILTGVISCSRSLGIAQSIHPQF